MPSQYRAPDPVPTFTLCCRTPGCGGRLAFPRDAGGAALPLVDQLTRHPLDAGGGARAECPECHVVWHEDALRG